MRLLLALLLVSSICSAAELQEKHVQVVLDPSNYALGEHEIYFSGSKDAYIKSYSITALGQPLQPGQYGFAYLWTDARHSALYLPLNERTTRWREDKYFGADYIRIPAGYYLCFMWQFFNGPTGLILFADITYFLEP